MSRIKRLRKSEKRGYSAKREQLGMDPGTANGRLKKMILFSLIQETERDECFRCADVIGDIDNLSIEHKIPWLYNSVSLFWDLDNIAFSHLSCNVGSALKNPATIARHGTEARYKQGCRRSKCRYAHATQRAEERRISGRH